MRDLGLCFSCLTDADRHQHVPAVTQHRGTGLCERCAKVVAAQVRDRKQGLEQLAEQVDAPPLRFFPNR